MNRASSRSKASDGEDPVEVRRYLEALRRNRWLIVAIVGLTTVLVVALSLALPKSYEATASIVVDPTANALGSTDATSVERELATMQTLVKTSDVLTAAAAAVPGTTRRSLSDAVTVAVDQNANIIDVTVSSGNADDAARLAGAVAQQFLKQQTAVEHARIARAQASLNDQIAVLRGGTSASTGSQLQALQDRLAQLSVADASAGSDLQLTQQPDAPTAPSSPKPLRNGVLALFASLFLAVLVALGREQMTPRISSERELGHLIGLPVLSGIPYKHRRTRTRDARAEYETYQTLSAAVRLALPPDESRVILVTSAVHAEGKTTVTQRLGRLLAQAGHRTLVVSGDLRWPKLDNDCDVTGRPGLRELLSRGEAVEGVSARALKQSIVPVDQMDFRGGLDVLPAGSGGGDASSLLTMEALRPLFEGLRDLGYAYVLVDAPPLLGVADTRIIAQCCDELLLVARLDRLTLTNVVDVREMLDRLAINPIGAVVVGARLPDSPYYWAEQPAMPAVP